MMMAGVAAEANRAQYVHAMVQAYNLHVIRENSVPHYVEYGVTILPERATARGARASTSCASLQPTIVRDR